MTSDRISPRGQPDRWFEEGAGRDSEHRIQECARAIFFGFARYNENFGRITRRAREHFENRHWGGSRRDLAERIDLYEKSVRRIVASLRREFGARVEDRSMWRRIQRCFGERVDTFPDANFAKTFFSSVTRRIFDTVGTDPEIEFVGADLRPTTELNRPVECRTYINWGELRSCVEQLLRDFALRISYRDITRDIERVVARIEERAGQDLGGADRVLQLEFIVPVFYQSTRAYLVGRMHTDHGFAPLVVALKNSGVTRHGRVIFYDYDEVCLVTDCRFRELPAPRSHEEEFIRDTWFDVGRHDVFPEEFGAFLGMGAALKSRFLDAHRELLTVPYWRSVQARHDAGKPPDVVPYHQGGDP